VSEISTLCASNSEPKEFVALRTVPVYLANGTRRLKVNALLDDCSSRSYLNSDVAAELGLEGKPEQITVNVLNDYQERLDTSVVEFRITSLDGKETKLASAYTTEKVTGNMQVVDWNKQRKKWKHLKEIDFPKVGPRPIVDLLLGADQADLIFSMEDIRGNAGEPIARLTPLGWTCIGTTSHTSDYEHSNFAFFARDSDNSSLDNLVRKYWEFDEPAATTIVKPEEKRAIQIASESIVYQSGHYSIGIPWKADIDRTALPDSYKTAMSRLQNTEKRLLRDPEIAKNYQDIFDKYSAKGYIRKVPAEEKDPPQGVYYLPHFPVLRPDKTTTKTRIVFDAAAKTEGTCLNDLILQGPKLQNELFSVLLRFRKNSIALICDISEMYLQIELKKEDRSFHRFLWRDMNQDNPPDVYEFNRVVFGVNCSPFLAQFVSQHNAKLHESEYPLAAEAVIKSCYMDDTMDSIVDVPVAIELKDELQELWGMAGMYARKLLSNSVEVMRHIPEADCVTDIDLDKGELPSVKTLGVLWDPKEDIFKFQVNQLKIDNLTKREFLKKIATLFDPLGLLSPYTVRARILLQEMWTSGVDWDEEVPMGIAKKAQSWFRELEELLEIGIPRCLRMDLEIESAELHTFVDASEEAYGSAVYQRTRYQNGVVSCRLIAAKSHVAPLIARSIPRLELMGAVLGLKLTLSIASSLDMELKDSTFWSDSVDVLYWVRGSSRKFKPFVSNRVGEIQANSNPEQWRHVPTKVNPADMITRGETPTALAACTRWWEGPEYLLSEPAKWPENKVEITRNRDQVSEEARSEIRKQHQETAFVTRQLSADLERLDPARFSKWQRLTHVKARVIRFVDNCRLPPELRRRGGLQPDEIQDAEIYYIRRAQKEAFPDEVKLIAVNKGLPGNSKLLPLKPFIDEEGIIRCNGRIQHAEFLPFDTRNPVILPRSHAVTKLIVKQSHERMSHGGTNHVLTEISQKYWILSAREVIREIEQDCTVCRRRKAVPVNPVMAPLPSLRLKKSMRAFSETSIDYGGPFLTKQGRGKPRNKRYLCLFTCLATRAVHLELSFSLDTDSFLNAFFRMASRRGMPADVLTDNGSNFVGGQNELEELKELDQDKIQNDTAGYGVKWHFQPPLAPHFSGVHESLIKSAKRAIYAILGNADINDEELQSAIVGAEGLLNSRPLTYQSSNPADLVPLTPNHFLIGQLGGRFAPESVDTTDFSPRRRWRRVQELVRHFWHRWMSEWLPSLNARKKWFKDRENLQVGDVVMVVSTDTSRGQWPLGRIEETHPGTDGNVRVVTVKVGKKLIKRPVVKLCLLERCEKQD
jgi:hypothetical protein